MPRANGNANRDLLPSPVVDDDDRRPCLVADNGVDQESTVLGHGVLTAGQVHIATEIYTCLDLTPR